MATRVEAAPKPAVLPTPAPAQTEAAPRWWWFGLGGLGLAAFVWGVVGSIGLFPLLTTNSDEGAYLAESAALRAGQILPNTPHLHVGAFQPWFAIARDGHFVYKYSPVFPALLAVGHWVFGAARGTLGALAAIAVVLVAILARELGASRRAALLASGAFLLAPLFLIQTTTFLPYVANLVLLLAYAVLLLRGIRTGAPWMVAVAGLALGLAFWARPFDAVVFGAPVLIWLLVRSPGAFSRWRTLGLLALGALPGLVGFLAYNAIATGSPFDLPFRLLDQSDTIGLGRRRVLPFSPYVDYTLSRAFEGTFKNLLLVTTWSFGSIVLVILAVFGYVAKPRLPRRSLLLVMLLSWPIGFFFFWGSYTYVFLWDGGWQLGPYYYLPMLVPLCVAAGIGLDRGLRRSLVLGVMAVLLCLAVSIPVAIGAVSDARDSTEPRQRVDDAVTQATNGHQSLVFTAPAYGGVLQHPFSFYRNAPDYGGERLYTLDSGNLDVDIAREHPDRLPVVMSLPDGYVATNKAFRVWADRQTLVAGRSINLGVNLPDPLPQSGLQLIAGNGFQAIAVPIRAGSGAFRVSVDSLGRVVVSSLDNAQRVAVSTPGIAPAGGLDVLINEVSPDGSATNLLARRIPIEMQGKTVSALWPGTITASRLAPDTTLGWASRVNSRAGR